MSLRKPIFDAIREARGKGFDKQEAGTVSEFLDTLGVPAALATGPDGIALIRQFEGCRLEAYPDPGSGGDPWTIGWGATGPGIARGVTWTQQQADTRLLADLHRFEQAVDQHTGGRATQRQFDALVSFAYNVGVEALHNSTLLRLHNGAAYDAASAQFARWNKAGGKVLAGLTRRRAAEAALYRRGRP